MVGKKMVGIKREIRRDSMCHRGSETRNCQRKCDVSGVGVRSRVAVGVLLVTNRPGKMGKVLSEVHPFVNVDGDFVRSSGLLYVWCFLGEL